MKGETELVEQQKHPQKAVHRGKIHALHRHRLAEIGEKTAGERRPVGSVEMDEEIEGLLAVLSAAALKGFQHHVEPIEEALHLGRIFGIP